MSDKTAGKHTSIIDQISSLDPQDNNTNDISIANLKAANKCSISSQMPFESPPRKQPRISE